MLREIEVIVEKDGTIQPLEAYYPSCTMRAIVTLLNSISPVKRPLSSFIGTLKSSAIFSADPVTIQKALRDEWD